MTTNKYQKAKLKVAYEAGNINKLEALFCIQENFTKLINLKPSQLTSLREKHKRLKEMVLSIMAECGEVLDDKHGGIQWKPWRKFKKPKDLVQHRQYVTEELVDILHFVIESFLAWGLTSEEVFNEYTKKMMTNIERQEGGY